jgi:hypothetical protein
MGLLDGTTQNSYYEGSDFGNYQFVSLDHIVSGFMISYVGENKLINKVNKADVQFHGMRAIQEFSYDIFRSIKSQEIEVPNTLKMILPQDYVNYCKISRVDSDGVKRVLYPTGKTSNPFGIKQSEDGSYIYGGGVSQTFRTIKITCPAPGSINDGDVIVLPFKDSNGAIDDMFFVFSNNASFVDGTYPFVSDASPRFGIFVNQNSSAKVVGDTLAKAINDSGKFTASNNQGVVTVVYKEVLDNYNNEAARDNFLQAQTRTPITVSTSGIDSLVYQEDSDTWSKYKAGNTNSTTTEDYDREDHTVDTLGRRYGLDPQHAQGNGTFYIDYNKGYIHFGSSLAGETIVLDYVSDGLGTDSEMLVHKFAEEAVYKWIAYGVISSRSNMPEYIVQRFKKERFAEARKAKIRLSNIKIEEFAQIIKGLGKPIK